ncbi:DNA-binding protein, histone-like, putative [Pustulibacterium marinum]|uniref:DNA-binding protein, histone-like, putative n=1 Tax=Pustulibacterium marinum TaxID=1224947 RepID=A0A1I7IUA2_9FLAO|nr:HU family DNA-binding protein [Pustulibacterium marinum]SFU76524.1 DNA-binding protein, histone-like, putative [Pustulibacterium marinum]
MSVKIKAVKRINPLDLAQPAKYYATAITDGETDLEALAEDISLQCTVTETDCLAVLAALERNVIKQLRNGKHVKLGRLGSFKVSVSAQGQDNEEDVVASDVTKNRVLFQPGKRIREMLKLLTYQKVA